MKDPDKLMFFTRKLKRRLEISVGISIVMLIMIINKVILSDSPSTTSLESSESEENIKLKDVQEEDDMQKEVIEAPPDNENDDYGDFKDFHLDEKMEQVSCTPHKHIMFLKTHKCASSTVQNIFLRYAFKNNLTFALPKLGKVYLGNPDPFKRFMIDSPHLSTDGKVDIFAVHSRLSPDHEQVVSDDAYWVTIVREPAALYESLFSYYELEKHYHMGLKDLLQNPSKLATLPRFTGKLGKNQMLFDFGYDENLSQTNLYKAIDDIEKRFGLVMVAEYMDESLILLRHLLCWSLEDVVTFSKNARREDVKLTYTDKELNVLKAINTADASLYEHFLKKHQRQVEKFGRERMDLEIAMLQHLRDQRFDDCGIKIMKGKDASDPKKREYSGMVNAYVMGDDLKDQDCMLMSLPENSLLKLMREKQDKMLAKQQ